MEGLLAGGRGRRDRRNPAGQHARSGGRGGHQLAALTTGTYAGASAVGSQGPGEPGLDVTGSNGVGCATITGSFTVNALEVDSNGFLLTFDVTFEQHCGGIEPALRGHLVISRPPPPPHLAVGVTVASLGRVSRADGSAMVNGTVTCSQPVPVYVTGDMWQRTDGVPTTYGSFNAEVSCVPGTHAQWQATAFPSSGTPFRKGEAEVIVIATALDPYYGEHVDAITHALVRLRNGP